MTQPADVRSSRSPLSLFGILLGAIAFVFVPPLFGGAGIVLGAVGLSRNERFGWLAVGVSMTGLVLGMVFGVVVFVSPS